MKNTVFLYRMLFLSVRANDFLKFWYSFLCKIIFQPPTDIRSPLLSDIFNEICEKPTSALECSELGTLKDLSFPPLIL